MDTAPSNEPALNGIPSPMSPSIRSPSTSRSCATPVKRESCHAIVKRLSVSSIRNFRPNSSKSIQAKSFDNKIALENRKNNTELAYCHALIMFEIKYLTQDFVEIQITAQKSLSKRLT